MSTTTRKTTTRKTIPVKKTAPKPPAKKTTAPATASAESMAHNVGRLEYLDPATLVIDPFNHRKQRDGADTTRPDADLIASVEAVGVLTPVLVRPQADGTTYGVVWGQRRRNAALIAAEHAAKAGRPVRLLPCLIRDDLAGADDAALVASMIENKHRAAAHVRDDLDALEQLALMDISDHRRAEHGRALGYSTAEVKAANRAAKLTDEDLRNALGREFDLVEAADAADVGDLPDAYERLTRAKERDTAEGTGRGHWAHALQELKDAKAHRERRDAVEAELDAAGITRVRHFRDWSQTTARPLQDLRTELGSPISVEGHRASCSGHAAAVDPDDLSVVHLCASWREKAHRLANPDTGTADPGEAERRAAEADKRRHTIACNKAVRAARTVRQDFIRDDLGKRKDISDAMRVYVLDTITGAGDTFGRYAHKRRTELTAQFLAVPDPNADTGWRRVASPFRKLIQRGAKAKWWRPLLAMVAAAVEHEVMTDHVWRGPNDEAREWLRLLAAEGYTLSEIEQTITAEPAD
ncbi:hypothetical protein SRB5_53040 [Streptomyces sp. RB5]|uniref:ParB-like N-terminal domain-containing protein n=1 Tax=Streptomyces smaragdinus TaxID=2585196 RepID=A0A7K0CNQ8_9ACTN|nr:ParB/RepB/Spo0J family partition protein [Streptomyces smaragdinus]MQY15126.1 hypothetical protein [Streptomyces smaragdinus]